MCMQLFKQFIHLSLLGWLWNSNGALHLGFTTMYVGFVFLARHPLTGVTDAEAEQLNSLGLA